MYKSFYQIECCCFVDEQYVLLEETSLYRQIAGVADEQYYEDLFPESITIDFVLNNDDVRLRLKRNRNIDSDVRIYTDDAHDMISQWSPPSKDVSLNFW